MAEQYRHLELSRTELTRERRRRGGFGGAKPDDPAGHARRLRDELDDHRGPQEDEIPGFDPRRLLKLTVEGLDPQELEAIPGLSVVAEEGKNITVLFATEDALDEFRGRLDQIAGGRAATRKDILYAVQHFDDVRPEDRTGPAMSSEGVPKTGPATLDVELWPLDLRTERDSMLSTFKSWCGDSGAECLDQVNNDAVVMVRVRIDAKNIDDLLHMRDVRQVDLPPQYQVRLDLLGTDIQNVPSIDLPPENAPGVVVLDSGVVGNHPLLAPALGDSQSFDPSAEDGSDTSGHGTAVSGIALYGDMEDQLELGSLQPHIWLFSGRIADGSGSEPTEFVENRVARAVRYFKSNYGCKVFNLSFGDERRPYRGGHVDRFAATIDFLAREEDVLFVVSAGNFSGTDDYPGDWRNEYPGYLFEEDSRIIDPAPALNALTVGSIARHDAARQAIRNPDDPAYQPVARVNEPSPFTRSGRGPCKSIKPELVEYGGNLSVDARVDGGRPLSGQPLGVLTLSRDFAAGRLFCLDAGTSYSSARIANLATRIQLNYPQASANLIRALLVAHAEQPEALVNRFEEDYEQALRIGGYGRPSLGSCLYSNESRVTLIAEDSVDPNEHHFYEIPLPEDFYAPPARRERRFSASLAHFPRVRRTRLEYKECSLSFRIVRANSVDEVAQAYRRLKKDEKEPPIPECSGFCPSPNNRAGGTVQAATKVHKQINANAGWDQRPYFLVVTHSSPNWVREPQSERYSLAVVIEDRSEEEVKLYAQIRQKLQARARARAQL